MEGGDKFKNRLTRLRGKAVEKFAAEGGFEIKINDVLEVRELPAQQSMYSIRVTGQIKILGIRPKGEPSRLRGHLADQTELPKAPERYYEIEYQPGGSAILVTASESDILNHLINRVT